MLKYNSLRVKALIFSIALGTLPVLVFGVIAYSFANRNSYKSEVAAQESIADNLSNKLSRFFFERMNELELVANLPIINNPKIAAGLTLAEKQKILDRYVELNKTYDSLAVFNLNGDTILQSKGKPIPNHKKADYFQEILKTGQPFIGKPRLSQGYYVVTTAVPVREVNTRKLIGVVRAKMSVDTLYPLLTEYDRHEFQWYAIYNLSGVVFAGLDKKQIGKTAASIFPLLTQMQKANKLSSGMGISKIDADKHLITYTPIVEAEGIPKLNWSVVITKDTDKVFATRKQLFWTTLAGTTITALVGSGIAIVFANRTTKSIQKIANAIASTSNEIAVTVEQQERTISNQASSVSQTTTVMDELGNASLQTAEQAESSTACAREALTLTKDGDRAVKQTMEDMTVLKDNVKAIAEQIRHLNEQIGQITGISSLVANLANETNMLALNAAVEAVRAGEKGKGFSVVASEIRKLADESKKSAGKISTLVEDIQTAMNNTVMVTDEGDRKTEQTIELAKETAAFFTGITDAVKTVFVNNQQISLSAKKQALAMQEVFTAINSIDLAAKETVSGISQVKSSTRGLNKVASQLQEIV